jgi:hypothetical protein
MHSNDNIENSNERGRWHEKILSFQNASVYLQLMNRKNDSKQQQEDENAQQPSADEQAPNA